jgi:hypothetical protein
VACRVVVVYASPSVDPDALEEKTPSERYSAVKTPVGRTNGIMCNVIMSGEWFEYWVTRRLSYKVFLPAVPIFGVDGYLCYTWRTVL